MKETIIAAAQTMPFKGDVTKNSETHYDLINSAHKNKVQLIVFPELSLTGYEPGEAENLAFTLDDKRLAPLQKLSSATSIIIITGAPLRTGNSLQIASFILFPDNSVSIYTKHYLHLGEEKVFTPGTRNSTIKLHDEVASLAICADTNNALHPEAAAKNGSTIYLASSFITPSGYDKDADKLKNYAQLYNMTVLLSNFAGNSGDFEAAGRSAIWASSGKIISELNAQGEGLAIGIKKDKWTGKVVEA